MGTSSNSGRTVNEAFPAESGSQNNNESCEPSQQSVVDLLASQGQRDRAQRQDNFYYSQCSERDAKNEEEFYDNHNDDHQHHYDRPSSKKVDWRSINRQSVNTATIPQEAANESNILQQRDSVNYSRRSRETYCLSGNGLRWYTSKDNDVVQDNPSSSGSNWFCDLIKMARKHYFISALCLCIFSAVCLLSSVAISRTIGLLDLDSDTSKASENSRLVASRPAEEYEVRTFELVDLIESDKTFAYTKWRVTVRVPKSTPVHQQHSLGLTSIEPTGSASETGEQSDSKPAAEPDSNQAASERVESEVEPEAQYHLIGTRDFVSGHTIGVASDEASRKVPEDDQQEDQLRQKDWPAASSALVARADDESEGAGLSAELDDPIQVAASEMRIEPSAINSTIVDCFIVDIEKRYEQKLAIESQHKRVASTRRVGFKRMLATITTCRLLTWTTLAGQLKNATTSQPAPQSSGQLSRPVRQVVESGLQPPKQTLTVRPSSPIIPFARGIGPLVPLTTIPPTTNVATRTDPFISGVLDQVIEPVARVPASDPQRSSTQAADAKDPVGSLIGALVSWSQLRDRTTTPGVQQTAGMGLVDNSLPKEVVRADGLGQAPGRSNLRPSPVVVTQQRETMVPGSAGVGSTKAEEEANRASYFNMGISMMSGIVPNTLWCGLGDRAANYSELGPEFMVDACCRAHDHCPVRLKPFTADYGLINWSMSTRSHCDCDLDFNECLTTINSTLSNVIKTLYFRFIGLQCVDLDRNGRQLQPVTVQA